MRDGNLSFTVLGLVARRVEGLHGYGLKTEFDALINDFWQVNYGSVYRCLDVLERAGDLSGMEQLQKDRPNRRVYRITEQGKQTLDDWLLQPVSDSPRPMRDELSLKLLFLTDHSADTVRRMIRDQREIYLTRLAKISKQKNKLQRHGFDARVTGLMVDGAQARVRADLAWIERVERTLLHDE